MHVYLIASSIKIITKHSITDSTQTGCIQFETYMPVLELWFSNIASTIMSYQYNPLYWYHRCFYILRYFLQFIYCLINIVMLHNYQDIYIFTITYITSNILRDGVIDLQSSLNQLACRLTETKLNITYVWCKFSVNTNNAQNSLAMYINSIVWIGL